MKALYWKLRYSCVSFLLGRFYFKNEQKMLNGKFVSRGKNEAIALFTVHKAASSLLAVRLGNIFEAEGYDVVDFSSYFTKVRPDLRTQFLTEKFFADQLFGHRQVFFSAIRFPLTELDPNWPLKVILVLRDPRDVLVSHYFSTMYSHPIQNSDFFVLKQSAQQMSIDQYVLSLAGDFFQRYLQYASWVNKASVLYWRYEDMILDPTKMESAILDFVGVSATVGSIVSKEDFLITKEDPFAHKRNVLPGDHARKLKPETILKLNEVFSQLPSQLGYSFH